MKIIFLILKNKQTSKKEQEYKNSEGKKKKKTAKGTKEGKRISSENRLKK